MRSPVRSGSPVYGLGLGRGLNPGLSLGSAVNLGPPDDGNISPLVPAPPAVTVAVPPVAVPMTCPPHPDVQYVYPVDEPPSFEQTVNKIVSEGNHNNAVFMETLELHNPMLATAVWEAVADKGDEKLNIFNLEHPSFTFTTDSRQTSPVQESESEAARFGPSALVHATGGPGHRKSLLPPGTVDKYCKGPDAEGKFECTFESCGKIFKRRYNVRSHIQTHLCDRPYACDKCPATFVRPHDLRRHMKCHAPVKPHVCPCGQSFTRHDALSRHRQRMICVGGIETPGRPKKVPGRRGRPRTRPETVTAKDGSDEESSEEEERKVVGGEYPATPAASEDGKSPAQVEKKEERRWEGNVYLTPVVNMEGFE